MLNYRDELDKMPSYDGVEKNYRRNRRRLKKNFHVACPRIKRARLS